MVELLAAAAIGLGCAAVAAVCVPPSTRLAPRVRPFAIAARSALGHRDAPAARSATQPTGSALARLFGPPILAGLARASRFVDHAGDEGLARLLRQAGMPDRTTEQYRLRQLGDAAVGAGLSGAAVGMLVHAPVTALAAGIAGFVFGWTRSRRRLERQVEERAARIRLELYTVNHLLAMHVRTGAGAIQAVQRLASRGRGLVVGELREVLARIRAGTGEAAAFRRAAELTPEASAGRTYRLLAAGVERGVDLADGLLALSADIRDARREQVHKDAVRRRAAMLLPTIGILAPIMLLFIAAPLPSIVLGHR